MQFEYIYILRRADGLRKLGASISPYRRTVELTRQTGIVHEREREWLAPDCALLIEGAVHRNLRALRVPGCGSNEVYDLSLDELTAAVHGAATEMERELGLERTRAGLARAKAEGRLGGATAKHSHEAILEFLKLGFRKGAAAAGMSVPGFQKAVARARKWDAERKAKAALVKAKRKAKR